MQRKCHLSLSETRPARFAPLSPSRGEKAILLALITILALTACEVGPDYRAPEMKVPEKFAADAGAPPGKATIDAANWWKALNDITLNGLIDHAVKANPQLEIALAHVQEAREQEAVVLGTALPEVDASLGAARGTGSDLARGRADQTLASAENGSSFKQVTQIYGFDAGWELDLFGKYRREAEAARYGTQAAMAARNDVLITLIADLVRAYVDMRGLEMQLAVLDQNIRVAAQHVDYVQQRYNHGITNGLDVTLAQREQSTLMAERAPLQAQIQAAQYTIAVLCGEFPENMEGELEKPGMIPQVPQKLAAGLPLDLIRRRPDIHEAERKLAAANARIGVATANLFPHVALTGGVGYQGQGLGVTPVMRSFIWAAGPSIGWPVLDFGTLDALVNIADLETRAMLMNYRQTVLDAVRQVDTAASAYSAQQDRLRNLQEALEASQQSVSLARQRYERGLTDSLNVIDAQRQQFDLGQQYVAAQQAAADQFIALYKALGSGWEQYQKLPPIRQPLPAVIAALQRTIEPDKAGK